jgi:hypothetical protein
VVNGEGYCPQTQKKEGKEDNSTRNGHNGTGKR